MITASTKSHRGRPRLIEDEEVMNLSFRCPESVAADLADIAADMGCNKSEIIRSAIVRETRRLRAERRRVRSAAL